MTGDPKQRLGGYATDSLTDAERQDLLRAALDDQALFDTLVEEEGLRELLADPEARQHVLAQLEQPDAGSDSAPGSAGPPPSPIS